MRRERKPEDLSYLAGLAGAVNVLWMGWFFASEHIFELGWSIGSWQVVEGGLPSILLVLVTTAALMFAVELGVRVRYDKGPFIRLSDQLEEGRYPDFLMGCLGKYVLDLGVLTLAYLFYDYAGEYDKPLYVAWLPWMGTIWTTYMVVGLPYVILTRALQHDPEADAKDASYLLMRVILRGVDVLRRKRTITFGPDDKTAALGTVVKLFYIPVMSIIFFKQFAFLDNNYNFLAESDVETARHFFSVGVTFALAVDAALGWSGYVVCTRWIKNTYKSVEPTMLGWVAALICYLPFRGMVDLYFPMPVERDFLNLPFPTVVWALAIVSVTSYCLFALATACFGLRFSNLTNRGVIRTGPYAFVRHPAYATKLFSWWCGRLPAALLLAGTGTPEALPLILGLCLMTFIYWGRAITEEWHMMQDPEYVAYCEQVPRRFFPRLWGRR